MKYPLQHLKQKKRSLDIDDWHKHIKRLKFSRDVYTLKKCKFEAYLLTTTIPRNPLGTWDPSCSLEIFLLNFYKAFGL